MISSLPVEVWSDYMTNNVWPVLFNLPSGYTDNTYPVVGLFIALASKLDLTTVSVLCKWEYVCVCVHMFILKISNQSRLTDIFNLVLYFHVDNILLFYCTCVVADGGAVKACV